MVLLWERQQREPEADPPPPRVGEGEWRADHRQANAEAGAGAAALHVTEGGLAEEGGQGAGLAEGAEKDEAGVSAGWTPEQLQRKFPSVFSKKAADNTPAPTYDADIAHIHANSRRRFGRQLSSAGYKETVDVGVLAGNMVLQQQPQQQQPQQAVGERLESMHVV